MSGKLLDVNAYTIGWICALALESTAAQAFLDERHEVPNEVSDSNSYVVGRIGKHNVVIAVMPQNEYGTTSAATTAKDMVRSFPQIRLGLMVGIGGGAPSRDHDIRLGDVVISSRGKGIGGVIQFDYGKTMQDEAFKETGHLNQPPTSLLTAAAALDAQHDLEDPKLNDKVNRAIEKVGNQRFKKKYARPLDETDKLYRPEILHPQDRKGDYVGDCIDTCGDGPEYLVHRLPRGDDDYNPSVHYGLIASSNQVVKDAMTRDRLIERGVVCFEMEAAGLMNHFPCLIVRGICDYADSHKSSHWQPYAAMVAAAYAKDLLGFVNPTAIAQETRLSELVLSVISTQKEQQETLEETKSTVDDIHARSRAESFKEWLRPADPSENAERAREQRYPGTGSWFLTSFPFQRWLADGSQHLSLYGLGGCGKTVLTSTILDFLRKDEDQVLIYFFFDFRDSRKRSLDNLIRSLLSQLYSFAEPYASELDDLRHRKRNAQPSTNDLLECFQSIVDRDRRTVIVLDALDECQQERQEQEKLIDWIITLRSTPSFKQVKIITTARPEAAFVTRLRTFYGSIECVHLDKEAIKNDIESYITGCLRKRPGFHTYAPNHPIVKQIRTLLIVKADGMFRYAACQIDDIVGCFGPEEIEDVLDALPETIQETYKRSIDRIPQRSHGKAIRLLQFLVNLDRPLELEAAVDIVAVRSDFRPFAPGDRICPEDIVRLCPNLLSITDQSYGGYQRTPRRLQLAHLSVKEYLIQYDCPAFTFVGVDAGVSIVRTCLSYLLSPQSEPRPFEDYARFMWVEQAAAAETSLEATSAMAEYLHKYFNDSRAWYYVKGRTVVDEGGLETSCLHFSCCLDLRETSKTLISRGVEVDRRTKHTSKSGMNPLEIASYMDQVETVQLLLDAGVQPNTTGGHNYGSALRIACERGNRAVVKLLARNGADLHRLEGNNIAKKSPLQIAISNGDVDLVQLLIDERVDLNADCGPLGTALHTASLEANVGIVSLLLEHGANVNAKSGTYGHALQAASYAGHGANVRLLLSKGADVNAEGGIYGNALASACMNDFPETILYLVGSGANVNFHAPGFGNALQMYTGKVFSDWNVKRSDVLEAFLEAGAEVHTSALPTRNALLLAVQRGHIEAIAIILKFKDAIKEHNSWNGVDLLHFAVHGGNANIVRLLLDFGVEIRRALCPALQRGFAPMVHLLLARGADPNILFNDSQPHFNHSLLMESLIMSRPDIAEELVLHGADPNARTSRRCPNQTALHLALGEDFEEVVRRLLENGADPNGPSGFPPFTPLQLCVKKGATKYVRILLEHGADVAATGGYRKNLTATKMAEQAGNGEILETLKEAETQRKTTKRKREEDEDIPSERIKQLRS